MKSLLCISLVLFFFIKIVIQEPINAIKVRKMYYKKYFCQAWLLLKKVIQCKVKCFSNKYFLGFILNKLLK